MIPESAKQVSFSERDRRSLVSRRQTTYLSLPIITHLAYSRHSGTFPTEVAKKTRLPTISIHFPPSYHFFYLQLVIITTSPLLPLSNSDTNPTRTISSASLPITNTGLPARDLPERAKWTHPSPRPRSQGLHIHKTPTFRNQPPHRRHNQVVGRLLHLSNKQLHNSPHKYHNKDKIRHRFYGISTSWLKRRNGHRWLF